MLVLCEKFHFPALFVLANPVFQKRKPKKDVDKGNTFRQLKIYRESPSPPTFPFITNQLSQMMNVKSGLGYKGYFHKAYYERPQARMLWLRPVAVTTGALVVIVTDG